MPVGEVATGPILEGGVNVVLEPVLALLRGEAEVALVESGVSSRFGA